MQGLGGSASYQETIASVLNPLNLVEKIRNMRHPPVRDILTGFEGVVRPGEMLRTCFSGANHIALLTAINRYQSFWAVPDRGAAHS